MITERREMLRSIMVTAWGFARAEPGRPFADCLRGAWKVVRGLRESGAALTKRARGASRVQFSPLLYRSPSVNRHGNGHRAFREAYWIAAVGR